MADAKSIEINGIEINLKDAKARGDIETVKENQINLIEDDTSMEGISDSVHDTLTTDAKKIIPAINEVNDKFKDIVKKTEIVDGKLYLLKSDGTRIDGGTTLPASTETVVSNKTVKLSDVKPIGEIWNNPANVTYMAWPLGCLQYDKELDRIVQICGCNATHTEGNDDSGCYIAYINPNTYEVIDPVKVIDSSGNHIKNCSGFCITSTGEWLLTVNYSLYRSSDKGITWTLQGEFVDSKGVTLKTTYNIISAYRNFYQFKNGRLAVGAWASKKVYMFYSDDNGITWSASEIGFIAQGSQEPCFIEMEEGKILSVIRKTMFGTGLTDWSATAKRQIEPAYISYSEDNGTTWSTPVASTKLTEMTACPCFGFNHEDEGIIELFYCSRYNHGNSEGVMYQTKATYKDARNDNFDEPVVVLYPTTPKKDSGAGSDFGYVTGCKDSKGKLHLVYYDVSDINPTIITYKYILGDRDKVVYPRNDKLISPISGWSSKKIDAQIQGVYTNLNAKISEIIISGGGSVPDTGDGKLYITDGLYDVFDFTDETSYNAETGIYTGKIKKLSIKVCPGRWGYSKPEDTTFNPLGIRGGYMTDNISTDITGDFTIEILLKSTISSKGNDGGICIGTYSSPYAYIGIRGGYTFKYVSTDNSSKTADIKWVTSPVIHIGYTLITLSKDENGIYIYANGQKVGEYLISEISDFQSIATGYFSTGYLLNNGESTIDISSICSHRIYTKKLAEEEILNNYKYEKNKFNF